LSLPVFTGLQHRRLDTLISELAHAWMASEGVALGLLEELGNGRSLPPAFWEKLADAAEQLRLERSAAWCHWRCSEIRNGVIAVILEVHRPSTAMPAG